MIATVLETLRSVLPAAIVVITVGIVREVSSKLRTSRRLEKGAEKVTIKVGGEKVSLDLSDPEDAARFAHAVSDPPDEAGETTTAQEDEERSG